MLVRGVPVSGEDIRVDAIQPQLRHRGLVERGGPFAAVFTYDNIRDHVVRLGLGEAGAGARIEARDQRAHAAKAGVVGVQQPLELAEIPRGKQRQVVQHQLQRVAAERRGVRQCLQLQRQTLGGVACADAGGFHALQMLQRDRQLVCVDLELGDYIKSEVVRWGKVLQAAGAVGIE